MEPIVYIVCAGHEHEGFGIHNVRGTLDEATSDHDELVLMNEYDYVFISRCELLTQTFTDMQRSIKGD